jgi:hypothetical protein
MSTLGVVSQAISPVNYLVHAPYRGNGPALRDLLGGQVELMFPTSASSVEYVMVDLGGIVIPGSPADFGKLIAEETEKWAKVIQAANIQVD